MGRLQKQKDQNKNRPSLTKAKGNNKPKNNVMENQVQAHVERMIVEKVELQEKVKKLLEFVNTQIYQDLDTQTKGLLAIQGRAMQTYLECLELRIKLSL